eukprot:4444005-Pyramimonas_sp.AAC.1
MAIDMTRLRLHHMRQKLEKPARNVDPKSLSYRSVKRIVFVGRRAGQRAREGGGADVRVRRVLSQVLVHGRRLPRHERLALRGLPSGGAARGACYRSKRQCYREMQNIQPRAGTDSTKKSKFRPSPDIRPTREPTLDPLQTL